MFFKAFFNTSHKHARTAARYVCDIYTRITYTHTHTPSVGAEVVCSFFNFLIFLVLRGAEGGASSGDVTDSRGASANSDFCSERGE